MKNARRTSTAVVTKNIVIISVFYLFPTKIPTIFIQSNLRKLKQLLRFAPVLEVTSYADDMDCDADSDPADVPAGNRARFGGFQKSGKVPQGGIGRDDGTARGPAAAGLLHSLGIQTPRTLLHRAGADSMLSRREFLQCFFQCLPKAMSPSPSR